MIQHMIIIDLINYVATVMRWYCNDVATKIHNNA